MRSIAFGPSVAVSAGEDRVLRVWDVPGRKQTRTLAGHTGTVNALALHGNALFSGSSDRSARLWNLADGIETTRLAHGSAVLAVAFDGKRLLTATRGPNGERLIRVFDTDGRSLAGPASIDAETRDGRTLIAAGSVIEIEQQK